MNKQIKIGIPRALIYYEYNILIKTYLSSLGIKVITSPETNKEIVKNGILKSESESCLAYKIFVGHVNYLVDKVDYILLFRIDNYGKNKKVCVKFNGIYDDIKAEFTNAKLLVINIDNKNNKYLLCQLLKLGLKFNKNPIKIISSLAKSYQKNKKYKKILEQNQTKILNKKTKKILIISHPYIIYDNYISKDIIKILNNNNIDIIYADRISNKSAKEKFKDLSPTLYWRQSQTSVSAIIHYQNNINGIIFVSAFPCGIDSLVNELMQRKIKNIPKLNIIIDETTTEGGIITRLESFIDLINGDNYG